MANVQLLAPKILKWEGGFVNDHDDKGVTMATWRQVGYDKDGDGDIDIDDIRLLTIADATLVLKKYYWDRWKADQIVNQSIAEILVDWVWASGKWGIVIPQRIFNLDDDGKVGNQTLAAVNGVDSKWVHSMIYMARENFIHEIVKKKPRQKKFLNGWLNRLHDYQYQP